jgi:hypothetical protein
MIPIRQGPVYEVLVSKLEFEFRLISEFITDLKVHYVAEAVSRIRKPTKDKVNLVSPFPLLSAPNDVSRNMVCWVKPSKSPNLPG